jgi:hypothetical protein
VAAITVSKKITRLIFYSFPSRNLRSGGLLLSAS